MIGLPRRAARWPDVLIVLGTVALALTTVRWADREFLRVEPPYDARSLENELHASQWVWTHRYRRMHHDWHWLCVAATLGVGGLLASDGQTWSRRGLSRPGTTVVLVVLLVGGVAAVQQTVVGSGSEWGPSFSLRDALDFQLPGAILGVWVVAWLRSSGGFPDWRERTARLVGWIWMADAGLQVGLELFCVGYDLLYG